MSDSSLRRPTQVVRQRGVFPFGCISSWRALVSHLVHRYDKRIFFNTGFSHRGLWALHLQLVDNVWLLVHEPFCVMPIGYVSYSPIDVSPLDSGVLSSAIPPLSGKVGLIVETAVYCTMAVDFALAAFRSDTGFLAGGTVIGGPVAHGGGGTTTGCEADLLVSTVS